MKTRLSLIAVVLVAAWMSFGDNQRPVRQPTPREEAVRHPRPRDLVERVEQLEQLVYSLQSQVISQQEQIERFAPLADEMEVITWSDGSRDIVIRNASLFLDRGNLQAVNLLAVENIYLFGEVIYP